jgi:hypothetical protein
MATIAAISEEREVKRLKNVAAVIEIAQKELPAEVSPEPTDPDWISRFFSYAPDVTSEQMQELWGKVLAGEVAQPGAYSLRVLDVLRNMTQDVAEKFTRGLVPVRPRGSWGPRFTSERPRIRRRPSRTALGIGENVWRAGWRRRA